MISCWNIVEALQLHNESIQCIRGVIVSQDFDCFAHKDFDQQNRLPKSAASDPSDITSSTSAAAP